VISWTPGTPASADLEDCTHRHVVLWQRFQREYQNRTKVGFDDYKKRQDPECLVVAQKLAPKIFFDFVANGAQHYVLKEIDVQTIGFREYLGGGFSNKEEWYDLVLSHKPGKRVYPVDRKLEFDHTGRIQLRLWSDNYYPDRGWWAPTGAYLIDIIFRFDCEGTTVTASTGPFQLDV
jgi:hypothetical protein